MVAVAAVLVDSLINAIIFMTLRSSYNTWCINNASNRFHTAVNGTAADMLDQDFYNCDRAWQDELKFGLLSFMMMTAFYASIMISYSRYYFNIGRGLHRFIGLHVFDLIVSRKQFDYHRSWVYRLTTTCPYRNIRCPKFKAGLYSMIPI